MNAIRDGLEQILKELPGGFAIRLVHELRDCKLAGLINAHKEIDLAFHRPNLGDVDMEKADRVSLELLSPRLGALEICQARDAMPLKAPM